MELIKINIRKSADPKRPELTGKKPIKKAVWTSNPARKTSENEQKPAENGGKSTQQSKLVASVEENLSKDCDKTANNQSNR